MDEAKLSPRSLLLEASSYSSRHHARSKRFLPPSPPLLVPYSHPLYSSFRTQPFEGAMFWHTSYGHPRLQLAILESGFVA